MTKLTKWRNNQKSKYWIKYFNDKIILMLIETSLDNFSGYKFQDFRNELNVENLISSTKFYNIMHFVIDKFSFSNKFFKWYDKLDYDNIELFNELIKTRILEITTQ